MAPTPLLRRLFAPALAGLVAALAPAIVTAAPANGVHVIELASDFDHRAQAQALSSLLRLRLSDGGLVVASENPSLVQAASTLRSCDLKGFDPSVLRENADRGVDARCQRAMAVRLGAKRLLWGHLYTAQDGALWAKVHLWQEGGQERAKAVPLDSAARERAADRLYLHLARPDEAADVTVTASGSEGELFVDGKSQGPFRSGLELTVPAGEHAFELRRDGKTAAQAKATAAAGKATEVALPAAFVPRTDIDPTEGFRDLPPVVAEEPKGAWKRPAGFVGLGLGAVALGVGIFSGLRVRSISDDFDREPPYVAYRRAPTRPGDNACDAAGGGFESSVAGASSASRVRDLCSERSTFRTLQFVGYGSAAAFAGVGAYLLLTAPKSTSPAAGQTASWQLTPSVGPSSAAATLHVRF